MHIAPQNTGLATDLAADEYGDTRSPKCAKSASSVRVLTACYL